MTSKKVGYSDDVWRAIRLLWEASPPGVSWRVVLEQVSATLNCEVPSIPTVSMRCKSDGWKKSLKKSLKNGAKNSAKNMQDFSPTADIENEIKPVISDDNFSGENGEILGLKNPKKVRGECRPRRQEHTPFLWTIKIIILNKCYLRQELSSVWWCICACLGKNG
jgi:hypothetical protein